MLSMRHVQQPCGTHSVEQPLPALRMARTVAMWDPFVEQPLQALRGARTAAIRGSFVQQPLPVLRGARHEVPCRHLMRKAIPEAVSSLSCGMHIADMRCQAGMKKKHDLPVMYNDYPQ